MIEHIAMVAWVLMDFQGSENKLAAKLLHLGPSKRKHTDTDAAALRKKELFLRFR